MLRLVATILLSAIAGPAFAQVVPFAAPTEDSREWALVRSLAGDEATDVLSAVVDLNQDGRAEIALKLGCQDASAICRTVVHSHDGQAWKSVFEANVGSIELVDAQFGSMRSIRSATGSWRWNGVSYVFEGGSGGPEFKKAPDDYQASLGAQFGEGAQRLVEGGDASVVIATLEPAEGVTVVLARLEGNGVCGISHGCPIRMLSVEDGTYKELLNASGQGQISLTGSRRGGWSDIAIERPGGSVDVYGWTGSAYASAVN